MSQQYQHKSYRKVPCRYGEECQHLDLERFPKGCSFYHQQWHLSAAAVKRRQGNLGKQDKQDKQDIPKDISLSHENKQPNNFDVAKVSQSMAKEPKDKLVRMILKELIPQLEQKMMKELVQMFSTMTPKDISNMPLSLIHI